MAKKTVLIKSKDLVSRTDASAFLRQLADKLEAGQVYLVQGNSEVALDVPNKVVLEIQVDEKPKRHKGSKRTLEVEVQWYTDEEGDAPGGLELK